MSERLNLYGSNLQPGLYVVLVAAYMAGMEGHFNISLLSNYKCDFPPDLASPHGCSKVSAGLLTGWAPTNLSRARRQSGSVWPE